MLNTLPFEVSRNGGEGETPAQALGFFLEGRMLWFARKLLKDRTLAIHFTAEVEMENGHSSE